MPPVHGRDAGGVDLREPRDEVAVEAVDAPPEARGAVAAVEQEEATPRPVANLELGGIVAGLGGHAAAQQLACRRADEGVDLERSGARRAGPAPHRGQVVVDLDDGGVGRQDVGEGLESAGQRGLLRPRIRRQALQKPRHKPLKSRRKAAPERRPGDVGAEQPREAAPHRRDGLAASSADEHDGRHQELHDVDGAVALHGSAQPRLATDVGRRNKGSKLRPNRSMLSHDLSARLFFCKSMIAGREVNFTTFPIRSTSCGRYPNTGAAIG